jgi:hypothetical protein
VPVHAAPLRLPASRVGAAVTSGLTWPPQAFSASLRPRAPVSSPAASAVDIALSSSAGRRRPWSSISTRSAAMPMATTPPGLVAVLTRSSRLRTASRSRRCSIAEKARIRSAGASNSKPSRSARRVCKCVRMPGGTAFSRMCSADGSRSTAKTSEPSGSSRSSGIVWRPIPAPRSYAVTGTRPVPGPLQSPSARVQTRGAHPGRGPACGMRSSGRSHVVSRSGRASCCSGPR